MEEASKWIYKAAGIQVISTFEHYKVTQIKSIIIWFIIDSTLIISKFKAVFQVKGWNIVWNTGLKSLK